MVEEPLAIYPIPGDRVLGKEKVPVRKHSVELGLSDR
jgi:hypothetical protein